LLLLLMLLLLLLLLLLLELSFRVGACILRNTISCSN
jgi:hypothetical protein